MTKKGAESLSLTTIIIAIIAVVVLVVVVAFFLGSSNKLTDSIKRVFFGTTAGYDYSLAIETCQSRCQLAKDASILDAKKNSAYCKTSMQVDYDPIDGEADYILDTNNKKTTLKYYCPPKGRYESAGSFIDDVNIRSLSIDCDLGTDGANGDIVCNAPTKFAVPPKLPTQAK